MKYIVDDAGVKVKPHCAGSFPTETEARIDCLPEEVWENAALYLSARDVLSLLSVNRWFYNRLGKSARFWEMLSNRDGVSCYGQYSETKGSQTPRIAIAITDNSSGDDSGACQSWCEAKNSFLFRCHKANPTKTGGGVKWYPVRPYAQFPGISDREGHISCVISREALSNQVLVGDPSMCTLSEEERRQAKPQERIVVITGGLITDDFSDNCVYLMNTGTGIMEDNSGVSRRRPHRWEMKQCETGRQAPFVYGATLTALPTEYSVTTDGDNPPRLKVRMRAVRFGGFRAGGYSNETSQVSMLTLEQEAHARRRQTRGKRDREPTHDASGDDDQDSVHNWKWQWDPQLEINWSKISTTGVLPGDYDNEDTLERPFLSRAYHTATLLLDRYLVVLGGMKSDFSILNEAILDTKTWTWIGDSKITFGADDIDSRPSGRHGHSVVLDDTRNRLVLFGGGSGSDLLRSGEDNSEVWELQLGDNWHDSDKFTESFPWKWKILHSDSNRVNGNNDFSDSDSEGKSGEYTGHTDSTESSSKLSPSETLCLGRCHHGIKISRDTVLLLFGSGRPSTNGVLAYDLKSDAFFRHEKISQHPSYSSTNGSEVCVKGFFPKPRFTGVAEFLEEDGYIITHGGYCSQETNTIGEIDVLDLAPAFRGRSGHPLSFDGLAIDDRRVSYGKVTNVQADGGRQDPDAALQQMWQTLMNTPSTQRQVIANVWLDQMHRDELPSNEHSLFLMTMIANGSTVLAGDDDDPDKEEDYDDNDSVASS